MNNSTQHSFLIPPALYPQNLPSNVASVNSFLVEVDYNEDIGESVRQEINERFSRSTTNKTYKFPRFTQGSAIKLKTSIYKFSIAKPSKKIIFKKRDRTLSPYSMTLNRSRKSKSPSRTEILTPKTPLPERASSTLKKINHFPGISKIKSEKKKPIKFRTLMK